MARKECVVYGLYDTKDNDKCIGILTAKEIAERFDMLVDSVYCNMSRGCKIKHRYELEKFKVKELEGWE